MPISGWRAITVKKEHLDRLEDEFKENREYYMTCGINSITALMQKKLLERMEEQEKLRKFANKIEKIPDKFVTTKRVINVESR